MNRFLTNKKKTPWIRRLIPIIFFCAVIEHDKANKAIKTIVFFIVVKITSLFVSRIVVYVSFCEYIKVFYCINKLKDFFC